MELEIRLRGLPLWQRHRLLPNPWAGYGTAFDILFPVESIYEAGWEYIHRYQRIRKFR